MKPQIVEDAIRAAIAYSLEPLRRDEFFLVTKEHRISHARQFAWAYIRARSKKWSYPMIGKHFGGFNHTTVLHGVRKAHEQRGKAFFEQLARPYKAGKPAHMASADGSVWSNDVVVPTEAQINVNRICLESFISLTDEEEAGVA